MKLSLIFSACVTSAVMAGVTLVSCNKDDIIESQALKPEIILENDYGVYSVKIGNSLTVSPTYINADNATFTWELDGEIVGHDAEWTHTWSEIGEYYPTVTVSTRSGTTVADMRVDVLELTPPVISLRLPQDGLKLSPGTDYVLAPQILHSDDTDGFNITWCVNGNVAGHEITYTFNETITGIYHIKIEAVNIDGTAVKEFDIEVTTDGTYRLHFPQASYFNTSTHRYTFPGRPVILRPVTCGDAGGAEQFAWEEDGQPADCNTDTYKFTPQSPGEYLVRVTEETSGVSATVKVVCVDANESQRRRAATAASSPYSSMVYEWVPAPGQFINDTSILGGMTGDEVSHDGAIAWAGQRLSKNMFVSLGAFGGYIIVGFDHSIAAAGLDYDVLIGGNAYLSAQGGSNEPGIVWVMQDVNGNGLPDDEWYELKGSEWNNPLTLHNYAVTYYRPDAPKMNVEWVDNLGTTGSVKYLRLLHDQDYYYPAWIEASEYTLYGTRISQNNSQDPTTGFWNNAAYPWGYVDNMGADNVSTGGPDGTGQRNGFKIANAVMADGSAITLKYIDFIKVQVGVMAESGHLGEISTEVSVFADYNLLEK